MSGYVTEINKQAANNTNFRTVLFTASKSQLVVMSLKPNEDIGSEVHHDIDQFLRVESGSGVAVLDGKEHSIKAGSAVVVPAGVEHNIINTSADKEMKLYTVYSPPEHPDGRVHKTKAEAEADEHHH